MLLALIVLSHLMFVHYSGPARPGSAQLASVQLQLAGGCVHYTDLDIVHAPQQFGRAKPGSIELGTPWDPVTQRARIGWLVRWYPRWPRINGRSQIPEWRPGNVRVPLVWLLAMGVLIPGILAVERRRRERREGCCRGCGYSLRGLDSGTVCPECGRVCGAGA